MTDLPGDEREKKVMREKKNSKESSILMLTLKNQNANE